MWLMEEDDTGKAELTHELNAIDFRWRDPSNCHS